MRNIFATFALLVVLSVSVFADGETPIGGGRACPPDQTECAATAAPPTPAGDSSPTSEARSSSGEENDNSGALGDIFDYLNSLFG